jgi:hypothetical protein
MATSKAPLGLPRKGEIAFVHYYEQVHPGTDLVKRAKGSPFKATITGIEYKMEGIMYTVRHITDNFTHVAHISDFVAMADGSYPRMKQIAQADDLAHKAFLSMLPKC